MDLTHSDVGVALSVPKKRLAVLPSGPPGESSTHSVAADKTEQPGAGATPSFLRIPTEVWDNIFLHAALSEPRKANDLKGTALASRNFHAVTKPFLEAPAARAAGAASSHADVEDAYQKILALHPTLRIQHAATLLARWPRLSAQDQFTAIPTLMATLDSISEVAKWPTFEHEDPFVIAAAALRKLRTVRAATPGFDGIVSRIIKLPLAKIPTWMAARENNLCDAIPKLSTVRRLGAFDQMLNDVAERHYQDGNREGVLYRLPKVLPSLPRAAQQSAALRLFQKAEIVGAHNDEIFGILNNCPLQRLNPACRLPVFNEMIRLGSNLPAEYRTWLADEQEQTWIEALDAQHEQHARTLIAGLRP